MWDDEINKRIKEAADQYHPSYDEDAWNKMEQLLDEHLPQKKDRRRIIYFFLLAVIVCGGLFFTLYQGSKNKTQGNLSKTISNGQPKVEQSKQSESTAGEQGQDVEKQQTNAKADTKSTGTSGGRYNAPGSTTAQAMSYDSRRQSLPQSIFTVVPASNNKLKSSGQDEKESEPLEPIAKANDQQPGITMQGKLQSSEVRGKSADTTKDISNFEIKSDSSVSKLIVKVNSDKKASDHKPVNKTAQNFNQNFGITFSLGPDISAVDLGRIGEMTLSYGAGLSYDISSHFTVRSGFYASKKIYSAGKDEYKTPPGSGNYNYLESVDANCNVYEIPLTVSYNFGKAKNHNWFASTGLSSYLMKKESYEYYYKYPGSTNIYTKSWSVSNKNKHYFSVLDISAGYNYFVNKRFTLSAEPYLRLPLTGIGAGKIRLNSGGVLFTATLKPFKK